MRSTALSILLAIPLSVCEPASTGEGVYTGESGRVTRELLSLDWHVAAQDSEDATLDVSVWNTADRPITARIEWVPRICSGFRPDATLEAARRIRESVGSGFPRLRVQPNEHSTIALPIGLTFEGGEERVEGCEAAVRIVVTAEGAVRDEILLRVPAPVWFPD